MAVIKCAHQHELLVVAVLLLEEEPLARRDPPAEDAAPVGLDLRGRRVHRHADQVALAEPALQGGPGGAVRCY